MPPENADGQSLLENIELGRDHARRATEARLQRMTTAGVEMAVPKGTIVMEGDSWFDYPAPDFLTTDVAEELEKLGFKVEAGTAHHGDTLEAMAYDIGQTRKVQRLLERLRSEKTTPRAILLSGGGNDIAGTLFETLLDHKRSNLPTLNQAVLTGLIDQRLKAAALFWIGVIDETVRRLFGASVRIILHGYDYAVPDGRGVWGGWWILPGPWLAPGFEKKGVGQMAEKQDAIIQIIDRFNEMLASIEAACPLGTGMVRYVDLRRTLPYTGPYKDWWANELHPTNRGYAAVAHKIAAAI